MRRASASSSRQADLLTPEDLEKHYGFIGGNWHHGELAVEQMLFLRPSIGAAQYDTPIPGLWLAGAGSHPGGGISGAAGWNAAERILKRAGQAMNDPRLHFKKPLLTSPFHARTSALNKLNAWGPWGGYTTVLAYDDEAMEYTAIRNQASVYDLSPMVKYRITGKDAAAYLDRLMIRNVAKLKVGARPLHRLVRRRRQAARRRHPVPPRRHRLPALLPGAPPAMAPRQRHRLRRRQSRRSPKRSPRCRCKALAPRRPERRRLRRGRDPQALPDGRFQPRRHRTLTISRTGFTGDLGYEFWTTPDRALELWDLLFEAGALYGIRPIGTNALNMARIEAGFIITNMDFIAAEPPCAATAPARPSRWASTG